MDAVLVNLGSDFDLNLGSGSNPKLGASSQ
jgi:hypothetical protein